MRNIKTIVSKTLVSATLVSATLPWRTGCILGLIYITLSRFEPHPTLMIILDEQGCLGNEIFPPDFIEIEMWPIVESLDLTLTP